MAHSRHKKETAENNKENMGSLEDLNSLPAEEENETAPVS